MQQVIFDQVVSHPNFQPNDDPDMQDKIITKCLERVKHEGNEHLFSEQELPAILAGQKQRLQDLFSDPSRHSAEMLRRLREILLGSELS